jgi:Transposase
MGRVYFRKAYRAWSLEEKRAAVFRMKDTRHGVIAAELGVEKRQLYAWREQLWREEKAQLEQSRERALERENLELKQALATKVLEADFLQGVLRRIEARRRPASGSGETASTRRSE